MAERGEQDEQAADALGLERAPEALEHGDGAVLSERAEARLHGVAVAPLAVLALELMALVADDVAGRAAGAFDGVVEDGADAGGGRLFREDAPGDLCAREVIEHGADAPDRWPDRGERERQPRHPQATDRRDECEIDVTCLPIFLPAEA